MDYLIASSLGTLLGLVFGSLLFRKQTKEESCCLDNEETVQRSTEIPEHPRLRTMFDGCNPTNGSKKVH